MNLETYLSLFTEHECFVVFKCCHREVRLDPVVKLKILTYYSLILSSTLSNIVRPVLSTGWTLSFQR